MKQNFTESHKVPGDEIKPDTRKKHDMAPESIDSIGKPVLVIPLEIKGEIGGPSGLEPTRFGDWEVNGRCSDF